MSEDVRHRKIRSYVKRGGRVSNLQRKALEQFSRVYCIPFKNEHVDFASVFGAKKVVVEIGFGMGIATAEIADRNPSTGYLGIEVFEAGVGKLLSEIDKRQLKNIRIIRHDATEVVETMIPDRSVSGFYFFFPDPWPKKRHHKRRLLQPGFLSLLASKLEPEGHLVAVTDWFDYATHILEIVESCDKLENAYTGFAPPLSWRPKTRYEQKGRAQGHDVYEIIANLIRNEDTATMH